MNVTIFAHGSTPTWTFTHPSAASCGYRCETVALPRGFYVGRDGAVHDSEGWTCRLTSAKDGVPALSDGWGKLHVLGHPDGSSIPV